MELIVNPKVSEWILKQPWLPQFINNCVAADNSPKQILCYLLGTESDNTVNDGFHWMNTPEGGQFWSDIDDEIIDVSAEEHWENFDTIIKI